MSILDIYEEKCKTQSDINEHLPTLKSLAEECETVVEMGVRTIVSTWALLAGNPKSLLSIDIKHPEVHGSDINQVEQLATEAGIEFSFLEADTTQIEIEECDFLFIDTWHVYDQLKKELELHGNKAKKYLAFHDTVTFGLRGETAGYAGLLPAIAEFTQANPQWILHQHYKNNNGLMVLKRVSLS